MQDIPCTKKQNQKKYYDKHKKKFHCEYCDLYFSKQSKYNKHCETKKHEKIMSEHVHLETDVFLDLHNLSIIKQNNKLKRMLTKIQEGKYTHDDKIKLLQTLKVLYLDKKQIRDKPTLTLYNKNKPKSNKHE